MIGAGVLPEDHNDFGFVKIIQRDRTFADAEHFAKSNATTFVAHVAAVGQVVGAVFSHEKLVEKCGFVGSSS